MRQRTDCTVGGCADRHKARGYCNKHYKQWRAKVGDSYTALTRDQRFYDNVILGPQLDSMTEGSPCWDWIGSATRGRPVFRWEDRQGYAAIYAYERFIGERPEGLELDHLCVRIVCVNPWHLDPVTGLENHRRMREHYGRGEYSKLCPNGHEYSEDNVVLRGGNRRCVICFKAWRARTRESERTKKLQKED